MIGEIGVGNVLLAAQNKLSALAQLFDSLGDNNLEMDMTGGIGMSELLLTVIEDMDTVMNHQTKTGEGVRVG